MQCLSAEWAWQVKVQGEPRLLRPNLHFVEHRSLHMLLIIRVVRL